MGKSIDEIYQKMESDRLSRVEKEKSLELKIHEDNERNRKEFLRISKIYEKSMVSSSSSAGAGAGGRTFGVILYDLVFLDGSEAATVGLDYAYSIGELGSNSATGGTAPYTFEVISGELPKGLSILYYEDGLVWVIYGVPEISGTSTFTIRAVDVNGLVGQKQYSIEVAEGEPEPELHPPVAEFSYDRSGIAPDAPLLIGDIVNFTDLSTNTPTSWTWTVTPPNSVDVVFSTSQNPSYMVASTGFHAVHLVASNADGSNTIDKGKIIFVSS